MISGECVADQMRGVLMPTYYTRVLVFVVLPAEEIVSPVYLDIFKRLGAQIRVIPWIPRTQYTDRIPGGKESFWGYSLNRIM